MGKGSNTSARPNAQTTTAAQTGVQTNAPPEWVQANYQALQNRANTVANTPYNPYGGQLTAGFGNAQNDALAGTQNAAAQPNNGYQTGFDALGQGQRLVSGSVGSYLPQAASFISQGAQPISPMRYSQGALNEYMSPYVNDVVNSTTANIDRSNAIQSNNLTGSAILGGNAFGGDRAGIAQAELARNQDLAKNQVVAGLYNQGFNQAQGQFNTQQGVDLAAQQANAQRMAQAGQAYQGLAGTQAGIGSAVGGLGTQQAALTQSQINQALAQNAQAFGMGTAQQQTNQAGLNAQYQQFLNQQQYPFQTAGWLGNMTLGIGGQSGGVATNNSNATTTPPSPNFWSQFAGLGLAGAGAAGAAGWFGNGTQGSGSPLPSNTTDPNLNFPQWSDDGSRPIVARGGRINDYEEGGAVYENGELTRLADQHRLEAANADARAMLNRGELYADGGGVGAALPYSDATSYVPQNPIGLRGGMGIPNFQNPQQQQNKQQSPQTSPTGLGSLAQGITGATGLFKSLSRPSGAAFGADAGMGSVGGMDLGSGLGAASFDEAGFAGLGSDLAGWGGGEALAGLGADAAVGAGAAEAGGFALADALPFLFLLKDGGRVPGYADGGAPGVEEYTEDQFNPLDAAAANAATNRYADASSPNWQVQRGFQDINATGPTFEPPPTQMPPEFAKLNRPQPQMAAMKFDGTPAADDGSGMGPPAIRIGAPPPRTQIYPDTSRPPNGMPMAFEEQEHNTRPDPWLSLMAAGFGMMGGTSPNAGVNIGKGALEGVKTYQGQQKDIRDQRNIDLRARQLDRQINQSQSQIELQTKRLGLDETIRKDTLDYRKEDSKLRHGEREDERLRRERADKALIDYRREQIRQREEQKADADKTRRDDLASKGFAGEGPDPETGEKVQGFYKYNPDTRAYDFQYGQVKTNAKDINPKPGASSSQERIIKDIKDEYAATNPGKPPLSTPEAIRLAKAKDSQRNKFRDEEDKADVKRMSAYSDAANKATSSLTTLDEMDALRKDAYTNPVAGTVANALGHPATAALNARASALTLDMVSLMKGSLSDKDLAFLQAQTPGIALSSTAGEAVSGMMRAGFERVKQRGAFYRDWGEKNGTLRGADRAWDRYVGENPLTTVDTKATGGTKFNPKYNRDYSKYLGSDAASTATTESSSQTKVGERKQFKQGWGTWDGSKYVPD